MNFLSNQTLEEKQSIKNLKKEIIQLNTEKSNLLMEKMKNQNDLIQINVKELDYNKAFNNTDALMNILKNEYIILQKSLVVSKSNLDLVKMNYNCFTVRCIPIFASLFILISYLIKHISKALKFSKKTENIVETLNEASFDKYIESNPDILEAVKKQYLLESNRDFIEDNDFKTTRYYSIFKKLMLTNPETCLKNVMGDCKKYMCNLKIIDKNKKAHVLHHTVKNKKECDSFYKKNVHKKYIYASIDNNQYYLATQNQDTLLVKHVIIIICLILTITFIIVYL